MSQPDWRALPLALRGAREKLGLAAHTVATGAGISYAYYWQMEHADRLGASPGYRGLAKTWRPSRHVVLAMCRVLGLDPAVLLPMAGHMTKRPIPDPV
jgi:transcriptional regulator with XRE-family HTH domain